MRPGDPPRGTQRDEEHRRADVHGEVGVDPRRVERPVAVAGRVRGVVDQDRHGPELGLHALEQHPGASGSARSASKLGARAACPGATMARDGVPARLERVGDRRPEPLRVPAAGDQRELSRRSGW